MPKKLKNWRVQGKYTPSSSIRWRQENNEERRIFVQVNNTFVGDRKPEVNIWKQQKDQKDFADYIVSGKKFNTKKQAIKFARKYMGENDD